MFCLADNFPLLKETNLISWGSEKSKVLNAYFASVFTSKTGLQECQAEWLE